MSTTIGESGQSDTFECPLCDAVEGVPIEHEGTNANAIIMRTPHFILIPALGPLVPGHALVVSKMHSLSLSCMPAKAHSDYRSLRIRLRQYCNERGDSLLEAEHGGISDRGPCIQHTHVHLFPRLGTHVDALSDRLPSLEMSQADYTQLPHIWMSDGVNHRLYDASGAMGQEVRRAIGRKLLLDDWDWAVNPGWQMVAITILYWSDLINDYFGT